MYSSVVPAILQDSGYTTTHYRYIPCRQRLRCIYPSWVNILGHDTMLSSVDRHLITAILVSLCSIGFSMLKHTSGKEKPLTTMVGFLVKCTKIEVCVFYCLCRYQQSTQRTAGKLLLSVNLVGFRATLRKSSQWLPLLLTNKHERTVGKVLLFINLVGFRAKCDKIQVSLYRVCSTKNTKHGPLEICCCSWWRTGACAKQLLVPVVPVSSCVEDFVPASTNICACVDEHFANVDERGSTIT